VVTKRERYSESNTTSETAKIDEGGGNMNRYKKRAERAIEEQKKSEKVGGGYRRKERHICQEKIIRN